MNKFCKVLAVILAVLMLVTMATACKQKDKEDWETIDGNGSSFESGNNEGDKDNNTSTDDDNDGDNSKDPSNPNSGTNGDSNGGTNGNGDTNGGNGGSSDGGSAPTIDQVVENYNPDVKYEMTANPLMAENKPQNKGVMPSFDIDSTGFVKNDIKIADLKGKKFVFFTAENASNFIYTDDSGKLIGEWEWWELLKKEIGLQIDYIESHHNKSYNQIMTYMNTGKQLDLIPTHQGGTPLFFKLSQALNPYINVNNLGNSPGVDEMTLNETKMGDEYRCISPIGAVSMLVYNQSLVQELGLKDPYAMWQNDEWDWNAWRSFLTSVPTTTADGKELWAYRQGINSWWHVYPLTNGVKIIALDNSSAKLNLINNWMDERAIEANSFFSETMKSIKQLIGYEKSGVSTADSYGRLFSDGTLMMSDRVYAMGKWSDYDYAKNRKYKLVPFPKSPNEGGTYAGLSYGFSMMIPKKVAKQANIPYAVKFAELWANRFTEAIFDYLAFQPHLQYTYEERKAYFDFCLKYSFTTLQMNEWRNLTGSNKDEMRGTANGYIYAGYKQEINLATRHKEVANVVAQAIEDAVNYGD